MSGFFFGGGVGGELSKTVTGAFTIFFSLYLDNYKFRSQEMVAWRGSKGTTLSPQFLDLRTLGIEIFKMYLLRVQHKVRNL